MSSSSEIHRQVDEVFTTDIFEDGVLLPAQEELRNLQYREGLCADEATVEMLAAYQMEVLNELHHGDGICITGNGQYYLQPLEDESIDANCETFFNVEDCRIEGRYAGIMATTWPRYDGFYRNPAVMQMEATLCVELEEVAVYDNSSELRAYLPQYRVFVPLNNTQLNVYRTMQDWLTNS